MAHVLCEYFLQVNGGVCAAAIAAFYLYSDRTDGFVGSLNGTDLVLTEIRRGVAGELNEHLKPIFLNQNSVTSVVLGPDGESITAGTYEERWVSPLGSESLREAIRNFVNANIVPICDYRTLLNARSGWCKWSNFLSHLLLALFAWQLIVLSVFFLDKIEAISMATWVVCALSTATLILVLSVLAAVFVRLKHYSQITSLRLKHGEL